MTIYSSDGEVYYTPLHHELEMPQSMLQPPEEGPIRVAGKKSYEPPPIKKPPTLPPLEPLTDPGNPPRGQYGPPGIEYPPWTVERPFAMNDNTPPLPLDITMPNIAGGLRQPPKPANDNDSRKPMKAGTFNAEEDLDANAIAQMSPAFITSYALPAIERLPPSKNVEDRTGTNYPGSISEFIDKTKAGVSEIRNLLTGRSPFQAPDLSEGMETELTHAKDIKEYAGKVIQDNIDRHTEHKEAVVQYHKDFAQWSKESEEQSAKMDEHFKKLDNYIAMMQSGRKVGKPPVTPKSFDKPLPRYPIMRDLKY